MSETIESLIRRSKLETLDSFMAFLDTKKVTDLSNEIQGYISYEYMDEAIIILNTNDKTRFSIRLEANGIIRHAVRASLIEAEHEAFDLFCKECITAYLELVEEQS